MLFKLAPSGRSWGPEEIEWIKSPFYCMACGARNCWQRRDEGSDYYLGSNVQCHTCKHWMDGVAEWPAWAEEVTE